ncbi:MAG: metal ABC transporter solute-binding protein, Zn/Mn family, partial [Nitrospinota bacterium]
MLRKLTPALLALALWAAWTPTPGRPEDRRLAVVATFSVLGDWVRNVGGDRVALRVLVGPDGDAHNFEPTPRDAVALARAALVFEIGLGYETWLDGLYRASRSRARRVAVTRGLALLYAGGRRPGRKEADPHVWHDASRAIRAVRNVRDALASADPAGAAVFEANADRYVAEL